MTVELFDVLDCNGRKTGKVIERADAHRSGAWHGAFHCLLLFTREGRDYAWFQMRSNTKRIAPGRFDVSVGGHYSSGEDSRTAGPREIREELGLEVDFQDLVPVGRRVFVHCFEPDIREYEFQDVFLLPLTGQPRDVLLQQEEVEGVLEMEVDEGVLLFSGELRELQCRMLARDGRWNRLAVTADSFVPCLDNYYLKLLLLARRYSQGERGLLVI